MVTICFFSDVQTLFKPLIESERGIVTCYSDQSFGNYAVRIEFAKSILSFDLDRMNLHCCFIELATDKSNKYHVTDVFNLLHPATTILTECNQEAFSREFIICQLSISFKIVSEYLIDVVHGNFNWIDAYRAKQEKDDSLIKEVLKLDYHSLIYQKFRNGDDSWKIDIAKRP